MTFVRLVLAEVLQDSVVIGQYRLRKRRALAVGLALTMLAILAYSLIWAIQYRIPHGPARVVDLRSSKSEKAYYVSFCAGLASNPHGFPGHCYIVWRPEDLLTEDSAGFVPMRPEDQIPSLWKAVPGCVSRQASRGNMRNVDRLVAIVGRADYEKTRRLSYSWNTVCFRCGITDCVTFSQNVASSMGLKTPHHMYKFPQDYLRELKQLN